MATKYLLPCRCGKKSPVEARQAGEQIACRCGARLDVPTLRGLAQLERVDERPPEPTWSRAQGILFVAGMVWVAIALAGTLWLFSEARKAAEVSPWDRTAQELTARIDNLSPTESLYLWRMFRDNPSEMLSGPKRIRAAAAAHRWWLWWTAVGAAATAAGVGWLIWIAVGFRRGRLTSDNSTS